MSDDTGDDAGAAPSDSGTLSRRQKKRMRTLGIPTSSPSSSSSSSSEATFALPLGVVLGAPRSVETLSVQRWVGFVPAPFALARVHSLRTEVWSGRMPWAAVLVRGIEDAPVSFSDAAHTVNAVGSGAHDLLVVLMRDRWWAIALVDSADSTS